QNRLGESGSGLVILFCRRDPFAQIGKIAPESDDVGGGARIAVAGNKSNERCRGKPGKCGECLEPGKRGGIDQIGKSLPPEESAAEDDGGFFLLNKDNGVAASVTRKKLHADRRRTDAQLE